MLLDKSARKTPPQYTTYQPRKAYPACMKSDDSVPRMKSTVTKSHIPGRIAPGAIPLDRRRFIRNAGLFAAGSALGGSMLGCGSSELYIPCLGPAAAPTPIPGMTYIRASQIG